MKDEWSAYGFMIRVMTIEDYDQVYALWKKIKEFDLFLFELNFYFCSGKINLICTWLLQ